MEINSQVLTFVMTILTGILLGGLFDCYRVLRRTFEPRVFMTWFTDLLYWLVATAVMFISLVLSNWGELRFYVFMGVLSGLGLYYHWLSLYVIRLLLWGIEFLIKILQLMKKIVIGVLIRPGLYFIRIAVWPFIFTYKKIEHWCHAHWFKPPDEKI
ncbi:spore cortex biosynthesis protein YabQ [Pelosinus sp. sgz500959]|uniref:spore cortex biosynthesis protein YabQ n=1 Tax=Pelosinus sp. sgz500959 TaxID=3242472 RepID=UPI00366A9992